MQLNDNRPLPTLISLWTPHRCAHFPPLPWNRRIKTEKWPTCLKPVSERVQNDYAAVELLKNFNATMHLFNRALELPGV